MASRYYASDKNEKANIKVIGRRGASRALATGERTRRFNERCYITSYITRGHSFSREQPATLSTLSHPDSDFR